MPLRSLRICTIQIFLETVLLKLDWVEQKFHLVANLCKVTTVSELVTDITRRRIPKDSVVAERKFATATTVCINDINACGQ